MGSLLCFLLGEILVWKDLAIVGVCITLPVFVSVVLCMPESPRSEPKHIEYCSKVLF